MRKFVKFLVQFNKKKEKRKLLQRIKIGASKLGIGFIYSIEKGKKYFPDLISCSLSSRYFCYLEKPNFLLSLATIQAIKALVMIACLWKFYPFWTKSKVKLCDIVMVERMLFISIHQWAWVKHLFLWEMVPIDQGNILPWLLIPYKLLHALVKLFFCEHHSFSLPC